MARLLSLKWPKLCFQKNFGYIFVGLRKFYIYELLQ